MVIIIGLSKTGLCVDCASSAAASRRLVMDTVPARQGTAAPRWSSSTGLDRTAQAGA